MVETNNKPEAREALTVAQLIAVLQKMPQDYHVNANFKQEIVAGITGAIDIGGDYYCQVFLENFDHDPDWHKGLESKLLQRLTHPAPKQEDVERVARAIFNGRHKYDWMKATGEQAAKYREVAKLAITAMQLTGGSQWQPIESAPKDRLIQVWQSRKHWSEVHMVSWNEDDSYEAGGHWFVSDGKNEHALRGDNLTHWRESPTPPNGRSDE